MAKTSDQAITVRDAGRLQAYPIASGETIYKGTFAGVNYAGYLVNITSSNVNEIAKPVVVYDTEITATANGSVSATYETGTNTATCYVSGVFKVTCTSITQADVGKTMYLVDNFTVDDGLNGSGGLKVGSLETYLSATSGYISLNDFSRFDGLVEISGSITGSTVNGAVLEYIANPFDETALVQEVNLVWTAAPVSTGDLNIGVSTGSTVSSDNLLDGFASTATGAWNNLTDPGTNGGIATWSTDEYITFTCASTASSGLTGQYLIRARVWN